MAQVVLRIPELLSLVFSHGDKSTNAACAVVCKAWLNPAINELWRHVDDPLALLRLLSPMHTVDVGENRIPHWLFSRFVLPLDWLRFEFYAKRIRKLIHSEFDDTHLIDPSVYAEIARTRPKLVLLPNLQQLAWDSKQLNQAILFMHSNLTELTACIDKPFAAAEGFMEARSFLIDAATRLPNLTTLDIRASFSVTHIETALVILLNTARHLKRVVLPRYWLSSAVVSALGPSPLLEQLQWEYLDQGHGDPKNVQTFEVSASEGSFPSLVDLSLEINLPHAIEFMESPGFPRHLKVLYVRSLHLASPSVVQNFFTTCSMTSRSLTNLYLDLHTNTVEPVPESHSITLETLMPLFSCPNITHFLITYNVPLLITDDDVELLTRRWPSLVSICFNDGPLWLAPPKLTLAALLHFAEHCPGLEELTLYLDATVKPPFTSDPTPFAHLHAIDFGVSPIADENAIALFLSRICPFRATDPVEILAGTSWDPILLDSMDPAVLQEINVRSAAWETVGKYFSMLSALRAEERLRTSKLEEELKSIRMGAIGHYSSESSEVPRKRAIADPPILN